MKGIKVIAFDCDGVMFDTAKANRSYYNRILRHFGKPEMNPGQFAYSHSHTADQSLAYLFTDKQSLEAAQAYRKTMSYEPFFKEMEIEPHLKPLLAKLKPRYQTAVATNRTDTMQGVLMAFGLEKAFDFVVTAADVGRPKPFPDPLLRVLEYFGTEPDQALYVGDSEVDEAAAKAAGIPLIAYKNPRLDAAFHISGLNEIATILDG